MITPELILSLGKKDFFQCLSRTLGKMVYIDHVVLFAFDHEFIPRFVDGTSRNMGSITSKLSQLYEKSFYYYDDPNLKWIGRTDKQNNAPLIQQLLAADIVNAAYRKYIYEDHGLLERISIIDHEQQKWFVLNLYRDVETGCFNSKEMAHFQKQAPLISALIKRHLSLLPPIIWHMNTVPSIEKLEGLVAGLGQNLSKREIEVCARSLQGMTREAVSLDLGIKPPTVATFMSRAYAKLRISSLNELFSLCLARLSNQR
ncbi:MAG: hypothetical protein COA93_11675 [Alphaproteobacteria bacterium]|nr:MAG: hypothetical protein COA93_11675 [Alphaproteobacteria bacterium]